MRKQQILSLVLFCCLGVAVVTVVIIRSQLMEAQRELEALRAPGTAIRFHDEVERDLASASAERKEGGLEAENKELKTQWEEAKALNEDLQTQLDEILKPTRDRMVSSTLRTHVPPGQVLVTGGYLTGDGMYAFAMVEPSIEELPDGRQAIRLKSTHLAVPDELVDRHGMGTLKTAAGNTLQHGELWDAEESATLTEQLSGSIIGVPEVLTLPGQQATIQIGDKVLKTTPALSGEGGGIDLDFRMEQPSP